MKRTIRLKESELKRMIAETILKTLNIPSDKYNDFEMNSWAHYTLKMLNEIRIAVEIIPEVLPGFFCVNETNLDSLPYQIGYHS